MADDFDFGFSAVSTEEFKKTQPTEVKVQKPTVSTNEFKELKSKIDSIVGMIQTLGDNDDTRFLHWNLLRWQQHSTNRVVLFVRLSMRWRNEKVN
jgi:hypothetical protein